MDRVVDHSARDEGKRTKREKREKGYAHLEGATSEEDLLAAVGSGSGGGGKSKKVFGKKSGGGGGGGAAAPQAGTSVSPTATCSGKDSPALSLRRKQKSSKHGQSRGSVASQHDLDNASYEPATSVKKPVFGVPLAEAVANNRSHDGVALPIVVRNCIDYVNENGLATEGVYRVSPPSSRLTELRRVADGGGGPLPFQDAHEAAALLKLFLRSLPQHTLTDELAPIFDRVALECPCRTGCCTCLVGDRIKAKLRDLPLCNYTLVAYLFQHIQKVIEMERYNRMGVASVGLVLQPTLNMNPRLLNILLQNTVGGTMKSKSATLLFDDIEIKRYVSPLRPKLGSLTQDLPSKLSEVEEELRKQQSLLEQLHEEVAALRAKGADNAAKEQDLWDVQTVVTHLKRQRKMLKAQEAKETSAESDKREAEGPCIEMFEEKQLLAIQMELKNQIIEEKRQIADLYLRLENYVIEPSTAVPTTTDATADADDEEKWRREYIELQNRHDALVTEIIAERERCARLRAEIEMTTVTGKSTSSTALVVGASVFKHSPGTLLTKL